MLSTGRLWHGTGTLAGVPTALLLALSALFVGGIAVSAPAAGAAISAPAVSSTGAADPAWSQLGATASRTWASAGLEVNFAASGDLSVSSRSSQSANWSLAPTGLGRGQIEPLEGGADATGAATRTYDNGQFSMWYSATATGLEQGFTLNRRPSGASGAVTIAMASAGGLTPVLTSPTSLSLLGHSGQAELNYSGLKVTDTSHKVLPAHLETSGSSIRIAFNDQGATYPVQVDPFIGLASLVPPTTASEFGTAIATSSNGTIALVGDPKGVRRIPVRRPSTPSPTDHGPPARPLLPRPRPQAFGSSVALSGAGNDGARRRPQRGCRLLRDCNRLYLQRDLMVRRNRTHAASQRRIVRHLGGALQRRFHRASRRSGAAANGLGAATIFTGGGSSWSAGLALALPAGSIAFGTSVALFQQRFHRTGR